MASRTRNRASQPSTSQPRRLPFQPRTDASAPEVVDPRWLLKALGATLVAAMLLAYLAVCLLVYQGGWQLLLHPVSKVDATPAVPFQAVRFDAGETGIPRLTGWWIPAASPTPATPTILLLHDGSGSLASTIRKDDLLHQAGVNLFVFDYRGFGQSSGPHPTEARMNEDAAAALDYLVATRHLPPAGIVPYGEGLGAVMAAQLVNGHSELPAFIVDVPDRNAFARATEAGRARLLPMRSLVQERFDIAAALSASRQPKLLLVDGPFGYDATRTQENTELFHTIPDPKRTVTFQSAHAEDAYLAAIRRFLDEYVPSPR